jgi:hypothetical protein
MRKAKQTQGFGPVIVNGTLRARAQIRTLFHFRAKNVLGMNARLHA